MAVALATGSQSITIRIPEYTGIEQLVGNARFRRVTDEARRYLTRDYCRVRAAGRRSLSFYMLAEPHETRQVEQMITARAGRALSRPEDMLVFAAQAYHRWRRTFASADFDQIPGIVALTRSCRVNSQWRFPVAIPCGPHGRSLYLDLFCEDYVWPTGSLILLLNCE